LGKNGKGKQAEGKRGKGSAEIYIISGGSKREKVN